MKKVATLVLLILSVTTTAQVGIGTLTPNLSAQLEIKSNTKGLLIPRLNIDNLSTASPVSSVTVNESLLVYNTNKNSGKGFYYWNGMLWEKIVDITTASNLIATQADNQQITSFFLNSSNTLTIELENGGSQSVDLSSLLGDNELLTGEGSPISNSIDPVTGALYVDTNSGEVYSSDGTLWESVVSSGTDGKSAYQVWLDAGNTGTETDFITSLKGDTGVAGADGQDAALSGVGNPNGTVTGIAGQVYTDTVSGILYKTSDGNTWGVVDSDTQDLSLSGNTISLVNGGTVDMGASSLAGDVAGNNVLATINQTNIATINSYLARLNSIRIVKNPTSSTTINNSDGTVIIEQTGLINLGLGKDITLPTPNSSNLGNKLVIVNRAGNGLLIGLSVSLNLNIIGGGSIKGSGLSSLGTSLLGINSSITIQCGFDGTNYYWYKIDSTSL
ncbi:hypothetical protein MK851_12515 [Tenacibaculum sp. 1B UA]|uniref:hypothetical protein n=1 Tax=unclassified Tenacibaculum TaxID=2635139 RepID=UPI0026E3A5ED|nr:MULTISPECIES: hypothetical protein [unclassified Tenacibaculum]MDO6675005.1 hypothetical protein [Tenacibaculum sp. 1_MG-2023]MDX8554441.1 hypothetical protein [Tenacibaculum sp. 1B UA]